MLLQARHRLKAFPVSPHSPLIRPLWRGCCFTSSVKSGKIEATGLSRPLEDLGPVGGRTQISWLVWIQSLHFSVYKIPRHVQER